MIKRHPFLIACFLFVAVGSVSGQSHRAFAQAGRQALRDGDCAAAIGYFQKAVEKKPSKTQYPYLLAQAFLNCNNPQSAAKYFAQSTEYQPDAMFYLGIAHKRAGEYQKAITAFEKYLDNFPDGQYAEQAHVEIHNCRYAASAPESKQYAIRHLGRKINSPYSDFAPVRNGDTLFYSTLRYKKLKDKYSPKRQTSKVVFSTKGSRPRPLKYRFNADSVLTANICPLPDHSGVYYNQCIYTNGHRLHCDLYFRPRKKKRGWKKPIRLKINSPDYSTIQPALYFDSTKNETFLLFASDRTGGQGGMDVWLASIDKNHRPGTPVNLSAINTAGDEESPFFDARTGRLYFSSTRHRNIGGFDLFYIETPTLPATVDTIYPLPRPINSPADEKYFVTGANPQTGYFASNREGSIQIDRTTGRCCYDLYAWTFTPPQDTMPATDVVNTDSSSVPDTLPAKEEATKEVKEEKEEKLTVTARSMLDLLPIRLYFDNDEPDKRTTATTTRKAYLNTYHAYLKREPVFIREFCRPLKGDEKENAQYELEDFFDYEVRRGGELLNTFTGLLLEALQNGEKVEIVLKGYTSPRAKTDYNKYLAARRISSVKNHFLNYQNGILRKYLNSGQLKISELPLGEATTPQDVSDALWDKRMSIYSIPASTERRVEILRLKFD